MLALANFLALENVIAYSYHNISSSVFACSKKVLCKFRFIKLGLSTDAYNIQTDQNWSSQKLALKTIEYLLSQNSFMQARITMDPWKTRIFYLRQNSKGKRTMQRKGVILVRGPLSTLQGDDARFAVQEVPPVQKVVSWKDLSALEFQRDRGEWLRFSHEFSWRWQENFVKYRTQQTSKSSYFCLHL